MSGQQKRRLHGSLERRHGPRQKRLEKERENISRWGIFMNSQWCDHLVRQRSAFCETSAMMVVCTLQCNANLFIDRREKEEREREGEREGGRATLIMAGDVFFADIHVLSSSSCALPLIIECQFDWPCTHSLLLSPSLSSPLPPLFLSLSVNPSMVQ